MRTRLTVGLLATLASLASQHPAPHAERSTVRALAHPPTHRALAATPPPDGAETATPAPPPTAELPSSADLEHLEGTPEALCALLFRGLGSPLPIHSPPQDIDDPDGPRECFERTVRRCPPGFRCESGRAGRTRLTVGHASPSESGHEVPVTVLTSPPLRGACFVVQRPLLRRSGRWVEDLDGDGADEVVIWGEIEIMDATGREVLAQLDVIHPYTWTEGALVLSPSVAAAWFTREAQRREVEVARLRSECEGTEVAEERSACEARVRIEARIITALRNAPSCTP